MQFIRSWGDRVATGCRKWLVIRKWLGLGLMAALAPTGACTPELDPISEIKAIRILGVRKSAPYAHPGETVSLQMRWEDGREDLPEEVETFFGFWCLNPPGDLYSECLAQEPNIDPQLFFNEDEVEIEIPEEALREDLRDPNFPDYGTAIVFYAICAGTFELGALESAEQLEGASGDDFLPRCLDSEGVELGPDDLIVGYSTIFVYEDLRNENPMTLGFSFEDEEVDVDCIDAECEQPLGPPELADCPEDGICIEACEDDADPLTCKEYRISALLDEASAEQDELAEIAFGTDLQESIWVSYFVDRGAISSPVKLVNDSELGWQNNYSTGLFAPKEPGPFRLWAVARDNRGGTSWVRVAGYVQP